jgi:hypothetical protein
MDQTGKYRRYLINLMQPIIWGSFVDMRVKLNQLQQALVEHVAHVAHVAYVAFVAHVVIKRDLPEDASRIQKTSTESIDIF